jgi:hypothetical protein
MTGLVYRPIGPVEDALVVLDATRRTYAGISRDGSYWHLIQPARLGDPRVTDGIRQVGQLVCTCRGGTFHGTCYRIDEAERLEGGMRDPVDDAASWLATSSELDSPAGAGEMVEAFRG